MGKQGSVSPQKLEKSDPVKVSERAKEGQPSRSELDPHLPEDRPTQKNKRKCWTCKSKLELVQQQVGICRCGKTSLSTCVVATNSQSLSDKLRFNSIQC